MGRIGYVTKGVVYVLIGTLALAVALRSGGETTDSEGALAAVLSKRYGAFLTAVIGCGLSSYALWRFIQGVLDTEKKGSDLKGIFIRLGYCSSGTCLRRVGVDRR